MQDLQRRWKVNNCLFGGVFLLSFFRVFLEVSKVNDTQFSRSYFSSLSFDTQGVNSIESQSLKKNSTSPSLVLVVGYWETSTFHPHRPEIEASILTNIQNPHLDHLIVILDSVSDQTNDCKHFKNRLMKQFLLKHNDTIDHNSANSNTTSTTLGIDEVNVDETKVSKKSLDVKSLFPHLSCVDHWGSQPNYYEMFQYSLDFAALLAHKDVLVDSSVASTSTTTFLESATTEIGTWSKKNFKYDSNDDTIIILSNADQVFDDTLRYAKQIPANAFFTLSTRGFDAKKIPQKIAGAYFDIIGSIPKRKAPNRCKKKIMNKAGKTLDTQSWDSYIYRASLLHGSLNPDYFSRLDFSHNPRKFFMNEPGAENAAVHAISKSILNHRIENSSDLVVRNVCRFIHSWHFHLTSKMHHNHGASSNVWPRNRMGVIYYDDNVTTKHDAFHRVPPPEARVPMCSKDCFAPNQTAGEFYYYEPHKDNWNPHRNKEKN